MTMLVWGDGFLALLFMINGVVVSALFLALAGIGDNLIAI